MPLQVVHAASGTSMAPGMAMSLVLVVLSYHQLANSGGLDQLRTTRSDGVFLKSSRNGNDVLAHGRSTAYYNSVRLFAGLFVCLFAIQV